MIFEIFPANKSLPEKICKIVRFPLKTFFDPGLDKIREKAEISIKLGVLQSLENVVEFETANGNKIHHLTILFSKALKF